jgi:hypothetical protein
MNQEVGLRALHVACSEGGQIVNVLVKVNVVVNCAAQVESWSDKIGIVG